jgi:outer membrane protein insertion porin family
MFKKILISFGLLYLLTNFSSAEVVKKIVVKNNVRISTQNIINFSKIDLGQDINNRNLNDATKLLYETSFFNEIKVSLSDNVLTIYVEENKIVQNIEITGLSSEKVTESILDQLILKKKKPYNKTDAKSDITTIKKSLLAEGYYFASLTTLLNENENNTVDLIYEITTGKKVNIKSIKFTGNKVFKSNKLINVITSEESRFWKFISNKKYLDQRRIDLDQRLLKSFYLNNGYYDVNINSVDARLTNKKDFNLIFNIESGPLYKINDAKLLLPDDYDIKNFEKITEQLNEVKNTKYSQNKINKIAKLLDDVTLFREYEFITASISENVIDNNYIDIIFEVSESEKKYIETINILGNNVTEEKVIRNNLEVDEGDPYNKILTAKSINNLKSLGIFKTVKVDQKDSSDKNKTNLDITVEEKPTGEISLGAGYGTSGGTIGFGVTENNYLGKGLKVGTNIKMTDDSISVKANLFNPNYNYTDRSLSTNIQSSSTDKLTANGYKTTKTGAEIGTAFEFLEYSTYAPKLLSYYEDLTVNSKATDNLKKQKGSTFDNKFFHALVYDKRNQKYQTNSGYILNLVQEIPLATKDNALLNGFDLTKYHKFENEMLTNISVFGRMINSIGDEDVRLTNRIGLPSAKLKGFEPGKVGPKDGTSFVGGNYAAAINFNTTIPYFFESLDTADIGYFIDAANVWGVDYSSSISASNTIRSSTGIAVNWYTPVGPLTFSLAQPLTKASTDITETFRFNIGTTF